MPVLTLMNLDSVSDEECILIPPPKVQPTPITEEVPARLHNTLWNPIKLKAREYGYEVVMGWIPIPRHRNKDMLSKPSQS
jgi:hypothetical protein